MGQENSDETVVGVQEPSEGGDKKGGAKVRARDEVKVTVTVVEINDKVALVEWIEDNKTCRGVVPVPVLQGKSVSLEELHRALPYGEDWEAAMDLHTSAWDVAEQLRRSGIWTKNDLMNKIRDAQRAWNQIHATDFGEFIKKVLS
jgi:hypothetical protein